MTTTQTAPTSADGPGSRRSSLTNAAVFSAFFAVTAALVFWYFLAYHRTNIWWLDGVAQHYPALYNFNVVVRGFLHHPTAGIPMWSWVLGLGADLFGTLQYYMYDPFALLSLVFPMHALELAFAFIFLAKLFAAGAFAYLYMRSIDAKPVPASVGALVYVFTTYTLFYTLRHPDYATPVVMLPLLILGLERVLRGRRPYLFFAAVLVTAFSNFYFFYQLTFIVVLYAVVRYIELTPKGERVKRFWKTAGVTAGYYVLASAMAAVSLIPSLKVFFVSSRAGGHPKVALIAPLSTIKQYLLSLVSLVPAPKTTYEGYAILAFLMLAVLLGRRRQHLTIKVMNVAFFVFLLFPRFGWLFNGFSFPSYRIIFCWGLFLGAALATVLSDSEPLSRREVITVSAVLVAYTVFLVVFGSRKSILAALPALLAGYASVVLLGIESWREARLRAAADASAEAEAPNRQRAATISALRWAVIGLVVLNIAGNAATTYSHRGADLLHRYARFGLQKRFDRNAGSVASGLPGDGFFRVDKQKTVSGTDLGVTASNDALVQGYHGITFYYSMLYEGVSNYLHELDDRAMRMSFDFNGFDDRAALLALNGVKYYIAPDAGANYVPYGFTPFRREGGSVVYQNSNALAIGYVYHHTLSSSRYATLTPLERQQAMLDNAVVPTGTPVSLPETASADSVIDVPYSVATSSDVQVDTANHTIRVLKPHGKVVLTFARVPGAELYVSLDGIKFHGETVRARKLPLPGPGASPAQAAAYKKASRGAVGPATISIGFGTTGLPKNERTEMPRYRYYWGDNSDTVNLGYFPAGTTSAYLRPTQAGVYSYSALKVSAVPMKGFDSSIARLRADSLQNVRVNGDTVAADFSANGDGLLVLSIPFTSGWTATIDGRPAQTIVANVGFTGIPVASGHHVLAMRYVSPGIVVGGTISLLAAALALGLLVVGRVRARKQGASAAA